MGALVTIAQPVFGMQDMQAIASAIAKGGLFGANDPNAVLTLCLVAQAEGKHPATAFQSYHIIKGKPAKKADAMLVDFLAAGGKVEWHALTDDIADATFSHPQGGSVRIAWDNARVANAGLDTTNPVHKKFPRAMKRARTVSEGVRTVFPGATSGMYVPEEVDDMQPAQTMREAKRAEPEAAAIEHKPEPKKRGLNAAYADLENMIREADSPEQLDNILTHEDMTKMVASHYDKYERLSRMVSERREAMIGEPA